MSIFFLCKPYLLSQKYSVSLYILLALLSSAIGIISPYLIAVYLDKLVVGADKSDVFQFSIIFGGLSALKIFKDYISSMLYTKMQVQMGYDLNIHIIKHIQSLSLSFINQNDGMYLNQRLNGDSYHLITFCLTTLQNIITNVIMFIVPLTILLSINGFITFLMIGFVIVYVVMYSILKKSLYKAGFAFRESQAKFFSKLYEQLKYIKLIKMNSIQNELNKRAQDSFTDFKETAIQSQRANFVYSSLDGIIAAIAKISLFVIGGVQILIGNFTIGLFTIFNSYFSMMLGSSRYFFSLGASYQSAMASYDRINDILNFSSEKNGNKILESVDSIELIDICFHYDIFEETLTSNKKELLNEKSKIDTERIKSKSAVNLFSSKFSKGSMYALTGPNGAGKSTIISLIMGLYIHEYNGVIRYNDTCIREIDMITTRKKSIGFAEQEPLLINDSIEFNLEYNSDSSICGSNISKNSDIKLEHNKIGLLEDCISTLNMRSFIDENDFSFIVNDENTNISGGEKQKISLLKVLYKNPSVMIFDEPTSALDLNTTRMFMSYLQKIKRDKIIIIVTHDEYIKTCCDEILLIGTT